MKRLALLTLRVAMALVFVYAGASKLWHFPDFVDDLARYHLLPNAANRALGLYVPWLETIVGLALLLRPARAGAWLLAVILSVGFSGFVASAWSRGLDISCGCFGADSSHTDGWAFARTLLLFAAAVFGFWRDGLRRSE